ncbi:hypothetical protein MMC18_002137 [Xylographa bjoerkii]|nr:hypothetical protein [Xylographa bjoerkii]
MDPRTGRPEQGVPSGPRHQGKFHRGGSHRGGYRKRKAWLEILPVPPPPPTRTHGNPFAFSNVSVDRAIPLPFDHPLKEELAEVKRVREHRRRYWLQLAEELPDDMNNPGSYDYQRWKKEEGLAEAKIEELAGLIALAERGIIVERAESLPVITSVTESAKRGNYGAALSTRRNERVSFPPAIQSARKSISRGNQRGTLSTRKEEERASSQRAPDAPDICPRQSTFGSRGKRKIETRVRREQGKQRSNARRRRNSHPRPAGSVIWTDDAKSEAVTKWMRDMGAAADADQTSPDIPLFIGSTGSSICAVGEDGTNWSDEMAANNPQRHRRLSPHYHSAQATWTPEDELHFEEAEAERETERFELAALLNAKSHHTFTAEKAVSVNSDLVEQPLADSVIKIERSEPAKLETEEKKSTDLLAAIMADLESWSPSPSPRSQSPELLPPPPELVQQPLLNAPPLRDRDQELAGAVWKALQARKAQQTAAATTEVENKDTSDWMDIDKVAPIEVMNLQDVPDTAPGEEEIAKMEDSGYERYDDFAAPVPLSGRVLYVGNLSFEADEEQLRNAFYNFQVESVIIPYDSAQERPPGHAFIIMSSAAEAESAVADSFELQINNRLIAVRLGSLPKHYSSIYEPPRRVVETIRGRTNDAIHSSGSGLRDNSLLSTRAHSDSRLKNASSSSIEPFDKKTVREVEDMLNNPTISFTGMGKVQLQQHKEFVKSQLKNIKSYKARREEGEELHFKKIRLINREDDFRHYKDELKAFRGCGVQSREPAFSDEC